MRRVGENYQSKKKLIQIVESPVKIQEWFGIDDLSKQKIDLGKMQKPKKSTNKLFWPNLEKSILWDIKGFIIQKLYIPFNKIAIIS